MTTAVPVPGARVPTFWCRTPSRPNFGDALAPWLVRRITGREAVFALPSERRRTVFVGGSIIAMAGPGCLVWGSGVLSARDPISPHATLLAVRGPLTRARALACAVDCPQVYGDPALLLPRFLRASTAGRRGVGLVPHFADLPRVRPALRPSAELRLIDIQSPVEEVVEQITRCELVLSSSLHGLIVSHAYGIPAVWVELRRLPSGDRSKFHDHQLSVGLDAEPPVVVGVADLDLDGLGRWARVPAEVDTEALWRACPLGGVA